MNFCDVFPRFLQHALIFLAATLVSLGGCSVAYAATITTAHDIPSSLQLSQSVDHAVTFTTPTGVAEGQTIIFTFSSAFGTGAVVENDMDISDDGVDLTTASDCTGSEQVSAVMAADILTMTVCAGDGGSIAAGSIIVVEIGTNATASGTGSNQITNPSTGGTYFLAVSGTFGDRGTILYPISSSTDQVTVSATVSVTGGDGGGGSTPTADTTAPSISSITVSGLTASQATISWTTSEMATSAVDYGTTASFGYTSSSPYTYVTSHSITLTGLSEGQTYYFRVRSSDTYSNQATSSTQTFTTLDTTAPAITMIEVVDITTSSARATWTTNESATSVIEYGTTTSYGSTSSDLSFVTSHSILLTGLTDGTTYHFFVQSSDASGNSTTSSDQTFTTDADDVPANVSSLTVTEEDTQLTLSWINPSDTDLTGIRGLICTDGYPTSPSDTDCTVIFDGLLTSFIATGLMNDTTYYFGVFAYDAALQFASGALASGMPRASEEELPSDEETPDEEDPGDDDIPGDEDVPGDDDTPGDEETPIEEGEEDEGQPPSDTTGETKTCGDGVCAGEETLAICPDDCGEDVPPQEGETIEPSEEGGNMQFLVAEDSLSLFTTDSGVVKILPETLVHLVFESVQPEEGISILITLDDQTYLLTPTVSKEGNVFFEAEILSPLTPGLFPLILTTILQGGTITTQIFTIEIEGYGYAFEIKGEEQVIIGDTVFTLYAEDGTVWDSSPFFQWNPFSSDTSGQYAWYVTNGSYVVRAQHEGYQMAQSAWVTVADHVFAVSIEMSPLVVQPFFEGQTIFSGGASFLSDVVPQIEQTQQAIQDLPGVETAIDISVPVLVINAGAGVLLMGSAFNLLPFLQYLFTSPLLLFWRKKRQKYGVVYHAYRKTPVDLATVRLYRLTGKTTEGTFLGKLVKSCVTNKEGKYAFFAPPGKYYLTISKSGYTFPSNYLVQEKTDGNFLDVYHGEEVEVTSDSALLTPNIPLDPQEVTQAHTPARIILITRLRWIQQIIAPSGVFLSLVILFIEPSWIAGGLFALQAVVYGFSKRLAVSRKPFKWGIVYDKTTGRPLANVVARIFEEKYHRLVETQVTDSKGRYNFLLGPNQYAARFEREGFVPVEVKPIDFTKEKESKDFSTEVSLEPEHLLKDIPSQDH